MSGFSEYSPYNQTTLYNGRVNLSQQTSLQIPSYQQKQMDNSTFYYEAVQGHTAPNELSNLFFSCNNIDALHEGIRYRVYTETNGRHVIGRQSDADLKVIMRSIYLQYGKNLPSNLIGQVKELNRLVLDWAVKEVMSNLKQYELYRKDVSTLPVPLERSPLITSKGTRTLELKSFV